MIEKLVLLVVGAIFLILGVCFCGWFFIRLTYQKKNPLDDLRFDELMTILSLIINTELDEYDKELLVGDRPITNQNFETFYHDIVGKVLDNISPELFAALSVYTPEDNVIRIIARRTKEYLRGKINGTV